MLGVSYYRRMYGKIQRAKALLDSGVIGRPVMAEAHAMNGSIRWTGFAAGWWIRSLQEGGRCTNRSHRIDLIRLFLWEAGARDRSVIEGCAAGCGGRQCHGAD